MEITYAEELKINEALRKEPESKFDIENWGSYLDREFYEIYEEYHSADDSHEKWIHVFGYVYDADDLFNPYRVLDYSGFDIPLSRFLESDFNVYMFADGLKQYIDELNEDKAREVIESYLKDVDRVLDYSDITMDTPCGMYVEGRVNSWR